MLHRLLRWKPDHVILQCAYITLEAEAATAVAAGGGAEDTASQYALIQGIAKEILSSSASSGANLLLWHTFAQVRACCCCPACDDGAG